MDFHEVIKKRYSVRSYENRPVEEEKLRRVLEAGRMAPSARNRQEWKFVVVRDARVRQKLVEASGQAFLAEAPVVIAVVGLTPEAKMFCTIPTDPVDCAIAIDHMSLAAVAEGLGSCWIGHFDQDACRKILGVPESAKIMELLPMGYPSGPGKTEKPRKAFQDVVCFDRFA